MEQLDFPFDLAEKKLPPKEILGGRTIEYSRATSILTQPSGFIRAFDYTLNPYSGCTFGCTYCYAAFFAPDRQLQDTWGYWLKVKENAVELLKVKRRKPMSDKTIYMSSVTDPYQPIERKLKLTQRILLELLDYHDVRLVVQTRSPLVTRDIDLLARFRAIQVNMTVTTDDDEVRKIYEPFCPGTTARLKALSEITSAGIRCCVTMTPLLPVKNPEDFADQLLATGAQKFVVQYFHATKSRFIAGTGDKARKITSDLGWDEQTYRAVVEIFRQRLPDVLEGEAGFAPV